MKFATLVFLLVASAASLSAQAQKQPEKVLIFLHDGLEILDFAGPMEVFIQAGFDVYTVGLTKEPITAMGKLKVIPDYSVEDYPKPDIVSFYGGGGAHSKSKDEAYKTHYLRMIEQADLQFSVCSGAFFLAESGVLEGNKATTFHTMTGMLQDEYPGIEVHENVRFIDNGEVITTAGISAGIDGALHLVAKLRGLAHAKSVAENMEYDKWVPNEGLILENPALAKAREMPFEKAVKDMNGKLYKGELLELINHYRDKRQFYQAIKAEKYLLEHCYAEASDYAVLGELFRETGKEAPINEETFFSLVRSGKIAEAESEILKAQKIFPGWMVYRNRTLNWMGYQLMNKNEMEKAIQVFQLNTVGYPEDWNVWDSLAESYMRNGQRDLAVKFYNKSLELNPENTNGKEMLEKLK